MPLSRLVDVPLATPLLSRAVNCTGLLGDVEIVPAKLGARTRVLSARISASAAASASWRSGAASSTLLDGPVWLGGVGVGGSIFWPFNPFGHFETGPDESLVLNLPLAVTLTVLVSYVQL